MTYHAWHQILNEFIQIIRTVDIHSVQIPCCSGHAFDMMLLDSVGGRSTTVAGNWQLNVNQRLRFFSKSKLRKRRWHLKSVFDPSPSFLGGSSWRRSYLLRVTAPIETTHTTPCRSITANEPLLQARCVEEAASYVPLRCSPMWPVNLKYVDVWRVSADHPENIIVWQKLIFVLIKNAFMIKMYWYARTVCWGPGSHIWGDWLLRWRSLFRLICCNDATEEV